MKSLKSNFTGLTISCAALACVIGYFLTPTQSKSASFGYCCDVTIESPADATAVTPWRGKNPFNKIETINQNVLQNAVEAPAAPAVGESDSGKNDPWWLTPLISASRATTYDLAIIVSNSIIFTVGTGSFLAGVSQAIYNSAKSYFLVSANELAWDYFDPPDRDAPFDLGTSLWTAAKHQSTYRPVDTVFKFLGLLVSVDPQTAFTYSLISAASSTTVAFVNQIAWDIATHPSSDDPVSRFFRGSPSAPAEPPKKGLEEVKPEAPEPDLDPIKPTASFFVMLSSFTK